MDLVLDRLVLAALRGSQIIEVDRSEKQPKLRLTTSAEDGEVMEVHCAVERQQERGAWYLPDSRALDVGTVQLAHWWRTSSRYTLTLADQDGHASVAFNSPGVVFIWSVLEPVFTDLALPLRLRSGKAAGQTPPEKSAAYWAETIKPAYDALGLGRDALSQFAPGSGWDDLDADRVMSRRDALIGSWGEADLESAARLRAYRIGQLVERYYSKAKNGQALRKRVMNDKAAERVLSGYFAGDWLAFLDYLGEKPHADEEVTTALPKSTLLVTSSDRAASVAAQHGVSPDEVERMLAAYWNQAGGGTPVERRVHALGHFWREFDEQHALQAPGVPEPYSLIRGSGYGRYSAELVDEVAHLWGTKLLARFPERLVTEPFPITGAAHAFGPAIEFFQGVALQAWHNTEGGRAHHELADLEEGMRKFSEALAATGHPADPALFADLRVAERRLGPVEEIREESSRETVGFITMSLASVSTRRHGFEILRDIITAHRRAWAGVHLDAYLHDRWRSDLQTAAEAYNRHAADKGKPPTIKQFAAKAAAAATQWFGGDLTGVYGALGIKSKLATPVYEPLLARDQRGEFGRQVRAELQAAGVFSGTTKADQVGYTNQLGSLAHASFDSVELYEAIGRPPALSQFGTTRFKYNAGTLAVDIEEAWSKYEAALERALAGAREAVPQARDRSAQRLSAEEGESDRPSPRSADVAQADERREPFAAVGATRTAHDRVIATNGPRPRTSVLRRLLRR
jgi:hypothetical protein